MVSACGMSDSDTAEPPQLAAQRSEIVGGSEAYPGQWPWQARLSILDGAGLCGGSLIAPGWVLTAAHCVYDMQVGSLRPASQFTVILGDHDRTLVEGTEQSFGVAQVIPHPNFNRFTYDRDVALLRLNGTATLNARVATVPMATYSTHQQWLEPGITSYVSGWGALSEGGATSATLRWVNVPMVSWSTCNAAYGGTLTGNMLCAGLAEGGKDSCQGDSGGPLAVMVPGDGYRLAGVVSSGYGCARPNFYGVYASVPSHISWVGTYVPTADFSVNGATGYNFGSYGQVVQFNGGLSVPGGVTYQWNFGDGTTLTTTQPVVEHTYPALGVDAYYPVSLSIQHNGSTSVRSASVTVFSASSPCGSSGDCDVE